MRTAEQLFYLAVFSFLGSTHASSHASAKAATKSKAQSPDSCVFEPGAVVSDACASYSFLEETNDRLHPKVHTLTQDTDFFSYYRLNLYNKKCPFWSDENGMCGNKACAVNTLENEEDIPLVWRAEELGKLEGPKARHPGKRVRDHNLEKPLGGELGDNVGESCVVEIDDECDERDYCVPEDESASGKGDYVSLVDNPERFTGYAGMGSNQVWEAIYRENCFSKPKDNGKTPIDQSPFGNFVGLQAQAAQDLRNVMKEQKIQANVKSAIAKGTAKGRVDPLEFDDSCLEKRVFYRVVSGMHASISTHLCWEHMNQTTGKWAPNLACYEYRLHKFPERVSNLYFNYALVLRAVGKIRNHVRDYKFCSADPEQDTLTKKLVLDLADAVPNGADIFNEKLMFADPMAAGLKEDFRNRFRNVSRIMDCVGCDKCRLWGKLQTAGYGTALKILFEFDEGDISRDPPLRRTELVALINTLDRISHSLMAVKEFRRMIEERDGVRPPTQAAETGSPKPSLATARTSGDGLADADIDVDFDQDEDDEQHEPTLGEQFWYEFDLVWRTFRFVIKSWIELPGKVFKISVIEVGRLWDFWLGKPVMPRSWEIRRPNLDEL